MKIEIMATVHSAQEVEDRLKEIVDIKNRCNHLTPGSDYTVKIRYEHGWIKAVGDLEGRRVPYV